MLSDLSRLHSPTAAVRDVRATDAADSRSTAERSSPPSAAEPAVVNHVQSAASSSAGANKVDQAQADQIRKLKARDAEVRAHEQAHASAGGQYAGAPSFEYQRGPDGHNYAVGGEVSIDVSAVPGDPEATIRKMQQVQHAALAPAEPSGADRAVAAAADATMLAARSELMTESKPKATAADSSAGDAARDILGALARRSAGAAAYDNSGAA